MLGVNIAPELAWDSIAAHSVGNFGKISLDELETVNESDNRMYPTIGN